MTEQRFFDSTKIQWAQNRASSGSRGHLLSASRIAFSEI